MANYLNSFRPLCGTRFGRDRLAENATLHPFVDASCRREPDLQHCYPAITAICRASRFAPRLRREDRVIYLTIKDRYAGHDERCWGLIAALRVVEVAPTHAEGAAWYRGRGLEPGNNCFVPETTPLPLTATSGLPAHYDSVRAWDFAYRRRVQRWPCFVITEPIAVDLDTPAVVTSETLMCIFGRLPVTRNPPRITDAEFGALLEVGRMAPDGRLARPAGRRV